VLDRQSVVEGGFEDVERQSLCPFAGRRRTAAHAFPDSGGTRLHDALRDWLAVGFDPHDEVLGFAATFPDTEFGPGMDGLVRGFRELLAGVLSEAGDEALLEPERVEQPGWQFELGGQRIFISVFSSIYPDGHARHAPTPGRIHVLFQPERAFRRCLGDDVVERKRKKQSIRAAFARGGQAYDYLHGEPLEAAKYIKSLRPEDPLVEWWRPAGSARR
jgi:hypothetical protein